MGNKQGKSKKDHDEEVKTISQYIDGKFEELLKSNQTSITEIRGYISEKMKEHLEGSAEANSEADEQAKKVKDAYDQLCEKHKALVEDLNIPQAPASKISEDAVAEFVEKLMADPKTNIYGFPDVIESAVYRNLLKTVLHAVAHACDESVIVFLGHQIRVSIQPLEVVDDKGKEEEELLPAEH
jgi:predicted nuclease with TOPRIM domain